MGNLCVAALPIGYLVFVKKQPIYKISQACRPVLKGQTDKFLGKLVDILFIFGLLGGANNITRTWRANDFSGIEKLTGIDGENMVVRSIILLTITVVFAVSSYSGLKKEFKN